MTSSEANSYPHDLHVSKGVFSKADSKYPTSFADGGWWYMGASMDIPEK